MDRRDESRMNCPACGEEVRWEDLRNGPACPICHEWLRYSRKQARNRAFIAYAALIVIGFMTYTSKAVGSWLLFLLLLGIPINWLCNLFTRPRLEVGTPQPRLTYMGYVILLALEIFVLYVVVIGGFMWLAGGSRRDLNELYDALSYPLAWLNPNFRITTESSFLDKFGTILGNSLFYGGLMYTCYLFVRRTFTRNRVTQIGITDRSPEDDE